MIFFIRILVLCAFAFSLWIFVKVIFTPTIGMEVNFVEPELGEITLSSKITKELSEGFCLEVPGYPYEIFLKKSEIEGNQVTGLTSLGTFQNGRELRERISEDCGYPECFSESFSCENDLDLEPIYH
jgi:hypothetical protein